MADTIQQSAGWFIITYSIFFISGIICLLLVITHIRYFCKNEKSGKTPNGKKMSIVNKAISLLTLTMVISMSIGPITTVPINAAFLIDPSPPVIGCKFANNAKDVIVYYIGKICMFLIFILRLHSIYGESAFGYKPVKLKIFAATITTTMFILLILTLLETKNIWYDFNVFGKDYRTCTTVFPFWYIVIYGLHEIGVTLSTLIMFILPLRKLLNTIKKHGGRGSTSTRTFGFKFTAIKVSLYCNS